MSKFFSYSALNLFNRSFLDTFAATDNKSIYIMMLILYDSFPVWTVILSALPSIELESSLILISHYIDNR